ncbi:MAG: hypothetical protein AABM30_09825 [Actinomycetota bacterium]
MAIRDKISKNVEPHLEPGETLQAAFPAQGGINPWSVILTGYLLLMWLAKYVVVAVTDKRILLFKASSLAPTKPKELLGTFPRDTRFGPVSGIWGKIELGGTRYYVHRRFHKDVEAADAAPGTAAAPAVS